MCRNPEIFKIIIKFMGPVARSISTTMWGDRDRLLPRHEVEGSNTLSSPKFFSSYTEFISTNFNVLKLLFCFSHPKINFNQVHQKVNNERFCYVLVE